MASMLEVLTNPDQFFGKKMGEDIDLKIPAAIILVVGLIGAANAIIMLQKVMPGLPDEAASFARIGGIVGAFSGLAGAFIMWLLYAGIFYLISSAFYGEGPFKRVLEFVAYGFIPTAFRQSNSHLRTPSFCRKRFYQILLCRQPL